MIAFAGLLIGFAVIVVPGIVGSLLIMRHLPGRRALGAFILWLPLPYLVLAAIIGANLDPMLSQGQATYNFQLAFVLAAFVVTIPWLAANLVGGTIGRRMRGRPAPTSPVATPATASPPHPDFPDWRHPDSPLLAEPEIAERMRAIAGRVGIPDHVLPTLAPPFGNEGEFVFRDRFDYIYTAREHGTALFEHAVAAVDQLLYLVFKDKAWMMASGYIGGSGAPIEQDPVRIAEKQRAILAGIDPRWGRQFAREAARKAGG